MSDPAARPEPDLSRPGTTRSHRLRRTVGSPSAQCLARSRGITSLLHREGGINLPLGLEGPQGGAAPSSQFLTRTMGFAPLLHREGGINLPLGPPGKGGAGGYLSRDLATSRQAHRKGGINSPPPIPAHLTGRNRRTRVCLHKAPTGLWPPWKQAGRAPRQGTRFPPSQRLRSR